MNIDGFISWQQFVKQPHVSRLTLNEQTYHYQMYLHQYNMMAAQSVRGGSHDPNYVITGLLLQEDFFYLLQEDGSNIMITQDI